jgi:hypothetical protein
MGGGRAADRRAADRGLRLGTETCTRLPDAMQCDLMVDGAQLPQGARVDHAVELADMIGQLRHELSRAMWAGENSDLKFEAEAVQLELTVGIEKALEPGVKVRFWVLDMGASGRRSSTSSQKITLTLRPVRASDQSRPAVISGEQLPGEE